MGALALLGLRARRNAESQLRLERRDPVDHEPHDADRTSEEQLWFDLFAAALSDPEADAAGNPATGTPTTTCRHHLFADALYRNALHAHSLGAVSLDELHGHLRVLCQNSIFRDYWRTMREQRASLESSSGEIEVEVEIEVEIARMVDELIHDMEEAETDEWWVVGDPPVD